MVDIVVEIEEGNYSLPFEPELCTISNFSIDRSDYKRRSEVVSLVLSSPHVDLAYTSADKKDRWENGSSRFCALIPLIFYMENVTHL